jgi:hypothetical protein
MAASRAGGETCIRGRHKTNQNSNKSTYYYRLSHPQIVKLVRSYEGGTVAAVPKVVADIPFVAVAGRSVVVGALEVFAAVEGLARSVEQNCCYCCVVGALHSWGQAVALHSSDPYVCCDVWHGPRGSGERRRIEERRR